MPSRSDIVLGPLDLSGRGLEVAPYFNPLILKSEHDVAYTDYTSTEVLRRKASENPGATGREVPAVDFVWTPGRPLQECTGERFDYAVASHVIEHVPNVIGWVNDILSVMRQGAVLALCVPDRRMTMDFYRQETTVGDLIGSWIEHRAIPTPGQVMDFLSQSFRDTGVRPKPFERGVAFEDAPREYSDRQALDFAVFTHAENYYLDVHCTVWTPQKFVDVFDRLSKLGILAVDISVPTEHRDRGEFIVHLTKAGEPTVLPPAVPVATPPAAVGLARQIVRRLLRRR